MKFDQILEHGIESLDEAPRPISGKVDAFSKTNHYKAVPVDDGHYVSVSQSNKLIGMISISSSNVDYRDEKGNLVFVESHMAYAVTKRSLESHYVPELLKRLSPDTLGSVI